MLNKFSGYRQGEAKANLKTRLGCRKAFVPSKGGLFFSLLERRGSLTRLGKRSAPIHGIRELVTTRSHLFPAHSSTEVKALEGPTDSVFIARILPVGTQLALLHHTLG